MSLDPIHTNEGYVVGFAYIDTTKTSPEAVNEFNKTIQVAKNYMPVYKVERYKENKYKVSMYDNKNSDGVKS